MAVTRFTTITQQTGADTAAFLRTLADRAEAGEVVSAAGVAMLPDGRYEVFSSPHLSRLQLMGALFDAAVTRSQG